MKITKNVRLIFYINSKGIEELFKKYGVDPLHPYVDVHRQHDGLPLVRCNTYPGINSMGYFTIHKSKVISLAWHYSHKCNYPFSFVSISKCLSKHVNTSDKSNQTVHVYLRASCHWHPWWHSWALIGRDVRITRLLNAARSISRQIVLELDYNQ